MKVHLIHGIHATRPGGNTSKLAPYFRERGFDVVVHSYGFALALTSGLTDWLNARRAANLAKHIRDGDVVVGHSNGCAIAYLIQRDYRTLRAAILINAALDEDVDFHATRTVVTLFNGGDGVAWWSSLVPFHLWGGMGRWGGSGALGNIENIDCASPPTGLPPLWGHSALFERYNLPHWGRFLAAKLREKLKA